MYITMYFCCSIPISMEPLYAKCTILGIALSTRNQKVIEIKISMDSFVNIFVGYSVRCCCSSRCQPLGIQLSQTRLQLRSGPKIGNRLDFLFNNSRIEPSLACSWTSGLWRFSDQCWSNRLFSTNSVST